MKIELSDIEIDELTRYQRNVSERSSYVKVTCILLLHKNYSAQETADILGINDSSVYRYLKSYQTDGLEKYLSTDYKGYWGLLSSPQISLLREELNTHLYTDSKSVSAWIKSQWNIVYTQQGVVDLLNRIGFTYKQTKQVPCETNLEAQVEFMTTLSNVLQEAREEKAVVYFADGVHPTHNTRSTHAWIEKGKEREQPTVSGRDRVNINAVLNALNPSEVIALECPSVNAQTTQELYKQVIQKNEPDKKIYIISDNARYYKNKELQSWVETTNVSPVFLPAYSPNLNLIERLWRFLRKKVINTHFYRRKEEFREAVNHFFENIAQYKPELEPLLTLNFHLRNSQSISV